MLANDCGSIINCYCCVAYISAYRDHYVVSTETAPSVFVELPDTDRHGQVSADLPVDAIL